MTEDPDDQPATSGSGRIRVWAWRLTLLLAVAAIVLALLLPTRRTAREAARRNGCINNLRQIALALLSYEQEHGSLPPAYTVDAAGKPLHSWRTLILPYLEERTLYDTIDLAKPWDDPVNSAACKAWVSAYSCPSASHEEGLTTYLGIVGPEFAFLGATPRMLSEVTDPRNQTAMVIDVPSHKAVPWMAPRDADGEMIVAMKSVSDSNHVGVMTVAFFDGRAIAIPLRESARVWRAMLTVAGDDLVFEGLD